MNKLLTILMKHFFKDVYTEKTFLVQTSIQKGNFWTHFNRGHWLNLKFINLIFRLCGQELEIINNLIKGHKRPLVQQQNEVTFSLYEQIEQGFYKCHDSIYDVPEGQRIPDLMKKRPATTTKVKDAETVSYILQKTTLHI